MSTFFGLDVGSSQVKVMQVKKLTQGFELSHFGAAGLQSPEELAQTIRQAVEAAGIKGGVEVNLALSESEVYTRIIDTPRLSETELASSIRYEAEQYVPIPLEEVDLSHQIISTSEDVLDTKTMKVLLIAVPKERVVRLTSLMDQAGLIPKSLETELFSLKRVFGNPQKSQVLVLFSHKTTDLMIVDKGIPKFLYSMPSGGLSLTKSLANELSLPDDQAEQYKRTYGLKEDLLEGKVSRVIRPLIDEVVNQIKKAFVYLQQQGQQNLPDQLVIGGGGALLPGLSGYLVKQLNLEVVVGDPLDKFIKDEEFKKKINTDTNPQLAVVTGLATKGYL